MLMMIMLVSCTPCDCPTSTVYINGEYTKSNNSYIYEIIVKDCQNETSSICVARNPYNDRCSIIVR